MNEQEQLEWLTINFSIQVAHGVSEKQAMANMIIEYCESDIYSKKVLKEFAEHVSKS